MKKERCEQFKSEASHVRGAAAKALGSGGTPIDSAARWRGDRI